MRPGAGRFRRQAAAGRPAGGRNHDFIGLPGRPPGHGPGGGELSHESGPMPGTLFHRRGGRPRRESWTRSHDPVLPGP